MNNHTLERFVHKLTVLLFVVAVTMLAMIFVTQARKNSGIESVAEMPSESLQNSVESEFIRPIETSKPILDELAETTTDPVIPKIEMTPKEPVKEEIFDGELDVLDIDQEKRPELNIKEFVEKHEDKPEINPEELEMLAAVIYQEAGGDRCCDECRRRVADVVLNRVADPRFPNTMEAVLTSYRQYGRFYWTGVTWPERAKNPGEKHAVERAYRIAEEVLSGHHSDLYGKGYIWQAEFKQGTDIVVDECGIYFGRG